MIPPGVCLWVHFPPTGGNKQKWVPLPLDPQPSHRDRDRRGHPGDRGDRGRGGGGGFRSTNNHGRWRGGGGPRMYQASSGGVCVCVCTYVRACVPAYKHVHTYCISVYTTILSVVHIYVYMATHFTLGTPRQDVDDRDRDGERERLGPPHSAPPTGMPYSGPPRMFRGRGRGGPYQPGSDHWGKFPCEICT